MAFGLCPMLTLAAIEALSLHGSDRQKQLYLPKLISGEWTGTMNLTEPQAGSDLAAVAMRAEADGTGNWRLTGQKIFITWGDHNVADNIVHMVLARLPDAPPGSRGLTLFLSPKRRVAEDGSLGEANTVRPVSIEHKLGIHGARPPVSWPMRAPRRRWSEPPNAGLANMFVMMNAARFLQVGVQGVGLSERAYQQALGLSPWSAPRAARPGPGPSRRACSTIRTCAAP